MPGVAIADLVVPAGMVAAELASFVVRVDLADLPVELWASISTHGAGAVRARTYGADLPCDVVQADTGTSTGSLYFKADLAAAVDNEFTLEVVPGYTAPAVTSPIGRNAVWSDFDFFLDFAGGVVDRAGTCTVTLQGSASIDSAGRLDCGDKTGNAVVTGLPAKRTAYTAGVTVTVPATGGNRAALSYSINGGGNDRISLLMAGSNAWQTWNGGWQSSSTGGARGTMTVVNGSARRILVDGVFRVSSSMNSEPSDANPVWFVGAEDTTFSERWRGTLNRAYARPEVLSDDWLAAEYLSWESPSAFYTITLREAGEPSPPVDATLDVTLPVLEAAAEAAVERDATLDLTLPALSLENEAQVALSGGSLAIDLPALQVESDVMVPVVASLDQALPALQVELAGEKIVEATQEITLPALEVASSTTTDVSSLLSIDLPALEVAAKAEWMQIRQRQFFPALEVASTADVRRVARQSSALPALQMAIAADAGEQPGFESVIRGMDPLFWYRGDADDVLGIAPEDEQSWGPATIQIRDQSGNGRYAVARGPATHTAGKVKDSLRSAYSHPAGTGIRFVEPTYGNPPSLLTSDDFSAFVLASTTTVANTTFKHLVGRWNLWWVYLYNNSLYLRIWNTQGALETLYIGTVAGANTDFSLSVSFTDRQHYEVWLNGVRTFGSFVHPISTELDHAGYVFGVGWGVNWAGSVQHVAYWKRPLEPGEHQALPASAFLTRPKRNEADLWLPSLAATTAVDVRRAARQDSAMPALEVAAIGLFEGDNRYPAGTSSWTTATPIVRGQTSMPAAVASYPVNDDTGLIWPYFNAWWKWTADTTDDLWFSTLRSIPKPGYPFDTVLVIYTEAGGELTQVASNDDIGDFLNSQVLLASPTLGETYYIRCGCYNDNLSSQNVGQNYVLDDSSTPAPTLGELVLSGGVRGPAGYVDQDSAYNGEHITSGSVSAGTEIPAGVQAWWYWVAESTGRVSFDALLTMSKYTGIVDDEFEVDLGLWDENGQVQYSSEYYDNNGNYLGPRGRIVWNVTAGQGFWISISPSWLDAWAALRISPIALPSVATPGPKKFLIDATPLDLSSYPEITYHSESLEDAGTPFTPSGSAVARQDGFYGKHNLRRSFAGTAASLDYNGALRCLWRNARTGRDTSRWWSKELGPSWNDTDPYNGSIPGYGTCQAATYVDAIYSSHHNIWGAAGVYYRANASGGFPSYHDTYVRIFGSHFQVGLTKILEELRARGDVADDASLAGVELMPDHSTKPELYLQTWYASVTRPAGYGIGELPGGPPQWGPDPGGEWWGGGKSEQEPTYWMSQAELFHGRFPGVDGGYFNEIGEWTEFEGTDEFWTPISLQLLGEVLEYEADPANDQVGRGLTLAYLPREVASLSGVPNELYQAFGYYEATWNGVSYADRVMMRVTVQEQPYLVQAQPLEMPALDWDPDIPDPELPPLEINPEPIGGWPAYDPGLISSQILFGPYPIKLQPDIEVLVFGPRHQPIAWPNIDLNVEVEAEVATQVPAPNLDQYSRPFASARFVVPEFTLVDGIPVAAKAAGKIAYTSETLTPSLASSLANTPHLADLGEDLRFPPILATSQTNTSTYRRHPTDPLLYRTTQEVTSLPSSDGSVTLSSPLPGPQRVSSYAYWRGEPAATTAVSFRPTSLGEESLIAAPGDWITGDQFTILLTAVLKDGDIQGDLSPLFTIAEAGAAKAGLFFDSNSAVKWWDEEHDVDDVYKRFRGQIQLIDDIRRASQPVLIGARINNLTQEVTLVAGDSRLRTAPASLASAIPAGRQLLIGDAGSLTRPGAFDLLDMRWWTRDMPDDELLSAAAAMADLWGVLR